MTAAEILSTYGDSINQSAQDFGVDPQLVASFIQIESSGNPNAYRAEPRINDASYGLGQLLYSTAQGLGYAGDPSGLYDPATNIFYTCSLIAQLQEKYGSDVAAIASAYNSGSGTAYETNAGVGNYVSKLLNTLSSFGASAVQSAEDTATNNPGSTSAIVILIAGALIYALTRA